MSAPDFGMPPALPGLETPPAPPEPSLAPRPRTRRSSTRDASRSTAATARRESTAASKRVGGDHVVWFVLQIVGLLVVIGAGLTVSASALVVAGGWQQTPPYLDPVTVLQVDGPMLVAFCMTITFKWRGFTGWLWAARIFGGAMTAFSAVLNFAYTVRASADVNGTDGLTMPEEIIGALLHASAPVLVFVCFEFFGQVITRPKRDAQRLRKLTVRELRAVEKVLKRRVAEAAAAEAKAVRG